MLHNDENNELTKENQQQQSPAVNNDVVSATPTGVNSGASRNSIQQQMPSTTTPTTSTEGLLSWQKRSISGITNSRADFKIVDDIYTTTSTGNGNSPLAGILKHNSDASSSSNHNNGDNTKSGTPNMNGQDDGTTGGINNNNNNNNDDEGLPRLVVRDLPYDQSNNNIQVRHNYGLLKISKLIQHDWFHVMLRFPTMFSLFSLISIWTLCLVIWAGMYVWVDRSNTGVECGLGFNGSSISFRGAFAFSLQTSTTVGYTLPSGSNAFFNNCPGLQSLIYAQMVFSMMFNAFLFAFFYTRIAKADSRGTQILFSSRALVSVVDDQVRFQIRIYDVDAINPVVEASIRMYVVTKSQPVPKRIRLLQPSDEFNSMLFLSLPAVASHHIDIYSLLHPPRVTPIDASGLTLRQVDATISSRLEHLCPVCGQNFGTYERWVCHMKYMVIMESVGDIKRKSRRLHSNTPKSDYMGAPPDYTTTTLDINTLQKHFETEISEVICVVEGIEPISSGSFSAIQSYRFDDIVFQEGARFRSCIENVDTSRCYSMKKNKKNNVGIRIDLDRFHEIDDTVVPIKTTRTGSGRRIHQRANWQRSVRGYDGIFFQPSAKSYDSNDGADGK